MTTPERRLAGGVILLATLIVSRGSPAMSGDGPYYLAVSHSIAHDADLDLRNQYADEGDYLFRREAELSFARDGRDGARYPSQGLGFSIAMTPVLAAAESLAAALPEGWLARARWNRERAARDLISLALAMLAAWVAVLTMRLTRTVAAGDAPVWPVALAVAAPPFIFAAIHPGPEMPAALVGVWVALELTRETPRLGRAAVALALLPWLHLRLLPIAVSGLIWLWQRARDGSPADGAAWLRALIPFGLSAVALAGTMRWMFGTVLPPSYPDALAFTSARWIPTWPDGLLSMDSGLLWMAPFWLLAVAGATRIRAHAPGLTTFAALSVAGLLITGDLFDAGRASRPPGMTLAPVLPVLVPFLTAAIAAAASRWRRGLAYALAAWALIFLAVVVERPRRLLADPGAGLGRLPAQTVTAFLQRNSPAARLARMGITPGHDALVQSARDGNVAVLELLIDTGLRPADALVVAAEHRQTGTVALLLARGAGESAEAARALAHARSIGDDGTAAVLAGAGVTIDTADPTGETALMLAVGDRRDEARGVLLRLGANANARSRSGATALLVAVGVDDHAAAIDLMAAGADVNAADLDGWTPLLLAARFGRVNFVTTLVRAGADVNAQSRLGWTPLMWGAYSGRVAVVATLLRASADPNRSSPAGLTALIRAASQGHGDAVRALLEGGADRSLTVNGATARDWALRTHRGDMAALLEVR